MAITARTRERRLEEARARSVYHVSGRPAPGRRRARLPSAVLGGVASAAMLAFYAAVVVGASRSVPHLVDQVGSDWYLILPIAAAFGVQVGLLVELRRLHRLHREAAAAGAAGAGTSTIGMLACCAHHLADLLPLVGATAAATFLYDYRLPFMLAGLGLNAVAIALAVRRLREVPTLHEEVDHACAPDGSSR
jgi:hypothetical protein